MRRCVKIFLIHFWFVLLLVTRLFYDHFHADSIETEVWWSVFLIADFPLSTLLLLPQEPLLLSIPESQAWFFIDILLPAVVFQIVGTCNWLLLSWIRDQWFLEREMELEQKLEVLGQPLSHPQETPLPEPMKSFRLYLPKRKTERRCFPAGAILSLPLLCVPDIRYVLFLYAVGCFLLWLWVRFSKSI
ncbi:MAG: hypothetical protein Q4D98_12275 [Planctomycetia bacterium]|nr:hypothetical protein [Planctomycetia bacterium]